MAELISAFFNDRQAAETAVSRLLEIGVPNEAISFVARGEAAGEGAHTQGDTAKGALAGLGLGAGLGALLGIGALFIPGIGPLIAAGALAQGLGVTAAAAAGGAILGGTVGTLAGAFSKWGLSEEDAQRYAREVERGAVFVGVDPERSPVSPAVIAEALERSGGRVERMPRGAGMQPSYQQPGYAQPGPAAAAAPQPAPAGAMEQQRMGQEMRVPLTDEVAQVRKVQHERGEVGIRKHLETETRHISEPVIRTHLETEVREVPAGTDYQADPRTAELRPGETLRVAVYEEELIIQKVPRVTREVLIHARPQVEQVERDIQLQRERVELVQEGDVDDHVDVDEAALSSGRVVRGA